MAEIFKNCYTMDSLSILDRHYINHLLQDKIRMSLEMNSKKEESFLNHLLFNYQPFLENGTVQSGIIYRTINQ